MKALALFALLGLLVALGCASVNEAERNRRIEYQERSGLTARQYHDLADDEAVDEGMDSLQVEAKYFIE